MSYTQVELENLYMYDQFCKELNRRNAYNAQNKENQIRYEEAKRLSENNMDLVNQCPCGAIGHFCSFQCSLHDLKLKWAYNTIMEEGGSQSINKEFNQIDNTKSSSVDNKEAECEHQRRKDNIETQLNDDQIILLNNQEYRLCKINQSDPKIELLKGLGIKSTLAEGESYYSSRSETSV